MLPLRRFVLLTLCGGITVGLAACASIMHGSSQEVSIGSTPTGARILIDGQEMGKTPVALRLTRKDKHALKIEMAGYQPYEMIFSRSTSGWVWGNIIFGGLPGLAIDAITGGLYKLTPEMVQASLTQSRASIDKNGKDGLVVTVVLRADSGWEKVGQLVRE